jgi:hypothetical protein
LAKGSALKMNLPSVDDLFSTEEERQEAKLKKLYDIPLSEIDDFPDHPYGTMDNRVAVQQIRRGGKLRYAISRIWIPYDKLKFHYPSLEGKRSLLPFYEVRRWGKLLFFGGAKRGIRELKLNSSKTKDEQLKTDEMLSHLGLEN